MPNLFCHHCGQPQTTGANFCSKCGTNLNSLAATPPPSSTITPAFVPFASSDEDDSYIDHLTKLNIRIDKLQVEVIKDTIKEETIGAVVSQPISPNASPYIRSINPNIDTPTFLEQFRKEAGAIKHEEK